MILRVIVIALNSFRYFGYMCVTGGLSASVLVNFTGYLYFGHHLKSKKLFNKRYIICFLLTLSLVNEVFAEQTTCLFPCDDIDCLARAVECSIEEGEAKAAVEYLKQARENFGGQKRYTLLLARAYAASDNKFWALRTISDYRNEHPDDCEVATWQAWLYIGLADLDEAQAILDELQCPGDEPWQTRLQARRAALVAYIKQTGGQEQAARTNLERALTAPTIWPEDRLFIQKLQHDLGLIVPAPIFLRAEIGGGYTSNALFGSPTDSAGQDIDAASSLAIADLLLRLTVPRAWSVLPTVEAGGRMRAYATEETEDLGYLEISLRPGLQIGGNTPSVGIFYKADGLMLRGGDAYSDSAYWFSEGHRGEIDMHPGAGLMIFAGAGQRTYREMTRSRNEADGGIAAGRRLTDQISATAALSVRRTWADEPAYSLYGGSAILSLRFGLPARFFTRVGASFGADRYPESASYFAGGDVRIDRTVKGSATLGYPDRSSFKVVTTYEYSDRFSSAQGYGFTDHRLLVKLIYADSFNPAAPLIAAEKGHVALDYGFEQGAAGADREAIREMLRQDESARRGSSCVE
jgi:hypothetical protein